MGSSRTMGLGRDVGEGRRGAEERRQSRLTAQLRTALASYTVRITDLSAFAARVEAPRLPDPGMIVCLHRGSAVVFGTMAWAEEGDGGILFDEELDTQLLLDSADEGKAGDRAVAQPTREAAAGAGNRR